MIFLNSIIIIITILQLSVGAYLSIFDGKNLQSQQIKKLDRSYNQVENKLTISSSGKDMLVEFLTDYKYAQIGFKASIHYIPIDPHCQNWLNMTTQILKSPEHPTKDCSWVITASSTDSTIVINIETSEVK